jgi:hypothetical protein
MHHRPPLGQVRSSQPSPPILTRTASHGMQTLEPLPLTEFAIGSNTASGCVGGLALDLRELRAFVTVVKDGRFAAAAHRLNLTQPAISHTIRWLEKECGTVLLERISSGVVTTTVGKLLLVEARAVLARHHQALAAISRGCDEDSSLRVGIALGLPPGLLYRALASLAADHPFTSIAIRRLCTARQLDALISGEQGHWTRSAPTEKPGHRRYARRR